MSSAPEVSNQPGPRHGPYAELRAEEPGSAGSLNCSELIEENPWGYSKRLRFITENIYKAFPLRDPSSIRVLDVGCGNGSLVAIPLARRGFAVTGLDLHLPSIITAQKLASTLSNAQFMVASVNEVELPAFDVAILSEVLEHVADPEGLLSDALKHLKADGIVLVTVPNGYGEFEIDSWLFRTLSLRSVIDFLKRLLRPSTFHADQGAIAATDNHDCGHVQFFTRRRLKRVFARCSVEPVEESAGSFVCGPIVCHTIARSRRFVEWNARIADRLPLSLVSSWYFVLQRVNH
jgi:SAM-dependent methyltransferase